MMRTNRPDTTSPPARNDNPDPHDEDAALLEHDDVMIGKAARWSTMVVLMVIPIIVILVLALQPRPEPDETIHDTALEGPRERALDAATTPPPVTFTEITADAGIDFVHVNGATGDKLLPETMGGGIAFLDYDNSGLPDLLLINSSEWDHAAPRTTDAALPTMALYRNLGDGTFVDVTADARLDITMYGMGVAVGDINNDGWVDIYITAVGRNRLLLNRGGTFEDVTDHAGVAGRAEAWSTSVAFVDLTNNGLLDLFVCNYVQWSPEIDFEIDYRLSGIGRAYGPPINYEGSHCTLYRNNGDGTFTDITTEAGIDITNPATGLPMSKALAVMPMDYDGDGWIDLYVANDTVRNFVFHNNGDGTFAEVGQDIGAAFDRFGNATGAMGIDAAWYRNDRAIGIAIGNFANEMSSLYVRQDSSALQFADEAITEGIGPASRLALTFGACFMDYDLDGRLDYMQANGHIEDDINLVQSSQHYRQSAQLFWNAGPDHVPCFISVPADSLGDFTTPVVGRGAAYADVDSDGDPDLIITQIAGPPLLLRNDQNLDHNWLRVKLIGNGDTVNRDAIGAVIELTAGTVTQRRLVMPARSYLSQVELPVTFGLGTADAVDRLSIHWPDGSKQRVEVPAVNAMLTIEQPPADAGP